MRNNRTDDRQSSSDCARSGKLREVGSQPLECGKVQNHAALTDVGQRRPDLAITRLYRIFVRHARKKFKSDGRKGLTATIGNGDVYDHWDPPASPAMIAGRA